MVRKLKSASLSTLILGAIFFLAEILQLSVSTFAFVVMWFAALGNFLYGIPVSFLSDYLTRKIKTFRLIVAGLIHIFFGFITIILLSDDLVLYAVICSFIFFLSEEFQKYNSDRESKLNYKFTLLLSLGTVFLFYLIIFSTNLGEPEPQTKTNNLYLIPYGFEGSITVYYNIQDKKLLNKEDESYIIPVNVEELNSLEGTSIESYGIYVTSTPSLGNSINNDQFYYINQSDKRIPIKNYCVHHMGKGSFTPGSGKEIKYSKIQLTNTDCGEDFFLNGKEKFYIQAKEVKNYWLDKLSKY